MSKVAIVGIHTSIGKTVASAIICQALEADYWKPVQAGNIYKGDSYTVRKLVRNKKLIIHKEAFRLSEPMSPHAAAKIDGVKIEIEKMLIPKTKNHLVIETAGGVMSPLNDKQTNLDFILHFRLPVIVVSQNYLGSINHTLLTVDVLKSKKVKVLAILFNGYENKATEKYILDYTKLPSLGRIKPHAILGKREVVTEAEHIKRKLKKIL